MHHTLLQGVEGFGKGNGRGFKPEGLEGGDHQRVLRRADFDPPGVGQLAHGVPGIGGQLAVAHVKDAEQAAAAFLDGPFVVLIPHGVHQSAEFFQRIKKIGHVHPAAGRGEGRVVVGGHVGDVDGAKLKAAHGLLFVPELHTGEELEVESVVRVFLGQFHKLVVEDVGIVLIARVHGRGDDHRDLGRRVRPGEGSCEQKRAEQEEKSFHAKILCSSLFGRKG